MKVRDITIIAFLTALLFVQEELLSFLPNIQLTIFLIILYSKKLGLLKTSIIVLIHTILDNLYIGSFDIIYFPFMLLGWELIPISLTTVFNKIDGSIKLALLSIMYSFIYCWLFFIPQVFILDVRFIDYFLADVLFEVILAASSAISLLWLYNPCSKAMDLLIKRSE